MEVIMKRILLFVICIVAKVFAFANGDPVVKFSSINRVANPEPLSISEIRIVHERVNITHVDGYNCFDVTYKFKNESAKDFPEIDYGFPIDYLVADEQETYQFTGDYISESSGEMGWNDKLIKDISFTFDGDVLPFHSSKESVREAGYEAVIYEDYGSIPTDAINRRWFYTKFAMKPYSEATFTVRYKVYANSYVGLYNDAYVFSYYARKIGKPEYFYPVVSLLYRYFPNKFDILYDFTPAKHFGESRPFGIDVNIDLTNLTNPWIGDGRYNYYVNRIERNIYFTGQETKPIDLTVYFDSDHSEKNVNRIINQFVIPESKYGVAMKANTIKIDFRNPMFVSDLACDMDTTGMRTINSIITYADGSKKQYKYESETIDETVDESFIKDKRIKSPILLTITDLYHDGTICNDSIFEYIPQNTIFEKNKIKSIKLVFDKGKKAKDVCRGIKVLDSRFIK